MRAKKIGPYTQGEIPQPLTYTFKTRGGVRIDLTGCDAVVELSHAGTTVEIAAVVAPNQTEIGGTRGDVTWTPADGDLDDSGSYELTFWAGDGGVFRPASRLYRFAVVRGAGAAIATV